MDTCSAPSSPPQENLTVSEIFNTITRILLKMATPSEVLLLVKTLDVNTIKLITSEGKLPSLVECSKRSPILNSTLVIRGVFNGQPITVREARPLIFGAISMNRDNQLQELLCQYIEVPFH